MNFPYSKKALFSLTIAAAVVASSTSAWAATTTQAQVTTANVAASSATQTSTAASTTVDQELTIAKAVDQALQTNSDLRSFRIDVDTADLNARLVNGKIKDISVDNIDNLDLATSKYVSSAKVESTKKVNKLMLKSTESKIKLGAQKAYYDLLSSQSDLKLKQQSLNRAQTQLKVAQSAFAVGTRAKTDVLQAEAGLARAQAQLALSQSNVEIARMGLNKFLGVDIGSKWTLKDDDRESQAPTITLTDAVASALKQRPEIVQKQEEINVAEINVDIIKKYSSIITYNGEMSLNAVTKAKLALEDENRAIELEVAQAYYNLQAAKTSIDAYQKAKNAATENYRLTNLRFENGLATALEVISAEEDLSTQENQFQQAVHNYNLAAISFDNALGN